MLEALLSQYSISLLPYKDSFHLLEVRLAILDAFCDILILSVIVQFLLEFEVEFQFVKLSLNVLVLLELVGEDCRVVRGGLHWVRLS